MIIRKNISLKEYNTLGLDYRTDKFIQISSDKDAGQLLESGNLDNEHIFILGVGSNLLFISDFHGTIVHPAIEGVNIEKEEPDYIIVSAGAGINWDQFVKWSVENGFGGIENLSLIPGTVGAAPVQNIGAYGVEAKDVIYKVKAFSLSDGQPDEFTNAECRFGYRDSIFKKDIKGKYLITKVSFRLTKQHEFKMDYGSLRQETEMQGEISLRTIREAVIRIRKNKLPDPEVLGNAGSFFKNPVVSHEFAENLKERYPFIPYYNDPSGSIKLAAGWLIEKCGWKGKRFGDAGVHDKQALILVNYGNASGKEIYDLSEKIRESVYQKFGISLEREVEVIDTH